MALQDNNLNLLPYEEDPEDLGLTQQQQDFMDSVGTHVEAFSKASAKDQFYKARDKFLNDPTMQNASQEFKHNFFENSVEKSPYQQSQTDNTTSGNTNKGANSNKGNPPASITKLANAGNLISTVAQTADTMLMGDKNFDSQSQAIDATVHTASSALINSGNPYAAVAGIALEVGNFATKATGQTVQGFDVDINNSGYGTVGHRESKSNRDFLSLLGLGGLATGNIEQQLIDRNTQAQMALHASKISEDTKFEQEARMNSVTDIIKQNEIALAGGIDSSVLVAKKGAKLLKMKDFLKSIKKETPVTRQHFYLKITAEQLLGKQPLNIQGKEYFLTPVEDATKIISAKNGAKLKNIQVSEEQSIIPEGSLHKNKHHIDVEGITSKGIPVITVADDNVETLEEIKEQEDTIVQHAEVEASEIIYNKDLTDYVENSLKEWLESEEDSILIEVGKRVCKELLFNTEDPDRIINQQKI